MRFTVLQLVRYNGGAMLQMREMLAAVPPGGLFPRGEGEGVPWRVSPQPLMLSRAIVRKLEGLGHILARFQEVSHALYRRSAAGREAAWLAPLLDAGKPEWLVRVQRSEALRGAFPRVIRPDLMLGADDVSLVELDSVPGGMGITLWLSQLYARAGFEVLGGAGGMAEGMRAAHPGGACIAVSAESADYQAEMRWLAEQLGEGFMYAEAEALPADFPGPVYRFWELFDTDNVPAARTLCEAAACAGAGGQGAAPLALHTQKLSPPPVAHLEEKLWLALLHMPGLQPVWRRELRAAHLQRLQQVVPFGWVVDPAPLPPQAALPRLGLHSWAEVAALGRAARRLVLKVSGFSPLAWGSRGVVIGHDVGTPEWQAAVSRALAEHGQQPWIMQEFREAALVEQPYYAEGSICTLRGRARLCPYYFRTPEGGVRLGGCLATITPADKKKIHGMRDAILVPCALA